MAGMSQTFEPLHDPGTGGDWLSDWMTASHLEGRRRHQALAVLRAGLEPLGVTSVALVGGPWLEPAVEGDPVWRLPPWPQDTAGQVQRVAEGVGDLPAERVRQVVDSFLASPAHHVPGARPQMFRVPGQPPLLLVDAALGGLRPGLVLLGLDPDAPLAAHPLAGLGVWPIAGLLRADRFRTHTERLGRVLSASAAPDWAAGEHPVDSQEVGLRVAETLSHLAARAAQAFEVATVAVFAPDPDDEYAWCLGASGTAPHAYDAGLVHGRPPVAGVGYGLTASVVGSPAWDPAGGPVLVRTLSTRDEVRARYRDLGFDEDTLTGPPGAAAPFLAERYLDAELAEAALRGPWVFTAQRLPPSLSPSGRNLVVRLMGRTLERGWQSAAVASRTSRDRKGRLASLAVRIHGEACRGLAEGLELWRDGLRREVLRELGGARRWPVLCAALATRLSARAVSLWRRQGGSLRLDSWSRPDPAPELVFDVEEELLAPRELHLLSQPVCLPRDALTDEGFAAWPPFDDACEGPHANVGCFPILAGGQAVGLLRIDGGMSLYGGLVRRGSRQGGLRHHRPRVLPHHLREPCEEVAALIALALPGRRGARAREDWSRFVQRVRRGAVTPESATARLAELWGRAPTRSGAAALVGVHRNTFRRHLDELRDALGAQAVPWE